MAGVRPNREVGRAHAIGVGEGDARRHLAGVARRPGGRDVVLTVLCPDDGRVGIGVGEEVQPAVGRGPVAGQQVELVVGQAHLGIAVGVDVELLGTPNITFRACCRGRQVAQEQEFAQFAGEARLRAFAHHANLHRSRAAQRPHYIGAEVLATGGEVRQGDARDIFGDGVRYIEGRHHRDHIGVGVVQHSPSEVALQDQAILEVDKAVRLGHRRAEGDVLELPILALGVLRVAWHDLKGDDVVLVAVHKEPLEIPRRRLGQVMPAIAIVNGSVRRAEGAADADHHGLIVLVDAADVEIPAAIHAAQVIRAGRQAAHAGALRNRHVADVKAGGADEVGVGRVAAAAEGVQPATGVPEVHIGRRLAAKAAYADVLQRHQVVHELEAFASAQDKVFDREDREAVHIGRTGRPQAVYLAVAVEVGPNARLAGQRLLAINGDNVGGAVEVGIEAGEAVAEARRRVPADAGGARRDRQLVAARRHGQGEAAIARLGVGRAVLRIHEQVGELLHQRRETVVAGAVALEAQLVQIAVLVPLAEIDLLPRVGPFNRDATVERGQRLVTVAELVEVGRVEGNRVLARRLGQLGVERRPRVGVGRDFHAVAVGVARHADVARRAAEVVRVAEGFAVDAQPLGVTVDLARRVGGRVGRARRVEPELDAVLRGEGRRVHLNRPVAPAEGRGPILGPQLVLPLRRAEGAGQ